MGAQADMLADSEGDVPVGSAVDTELVGRIEDTLIAVGRRVEEAKRVGSRRRRSSWDSVRARGAVLERRFAALFELLEPLVGRSSSHSSGSRGPDDGPNVSGVVRENPVQREIIRLSRAR